MGGDFISLTTNEVYKQLKKKPKKFFPSRVVDNFVYVGQRKLKIRPWGLQNKNYKLMLDI